MEQKARLSNLSHFRDCLVLNGESLYFISDLHIKNSNDNNLHKLKTFLLKLTAEPNKSSLFILGDLFDFWVSDYAFLQNEYAELTALFKSYIQKGNKVFYFEGNHDLHLKKFWESKIGAKVFLGPVLLEADGISYGVEHGDQMDPEDKGYIKLRWFLRTPIVKALINIVPSDLAKSIGETASRKSRRYTDKTRVIRDKNFKSVIETHIKKIIKVNAFAVHISGHVHHFMDETININEKQVRAINLGWWNEKPRTLKLAAKKLEVLTIE